MSLALDIFENLQRIAYCTGQFWEPSENCLLHWTFLKTSMKFSFPQDIFIGASKKFSVAQECKRKFMRTYPWTFMLHSSTRGYFWEPPRNSLLFNNARGNFWESVQGNFGCIIVQVDISENLQEIIFCTSIHEGIWELPSNSD